MTTAPQTAEEKIAKTLAIIEDIFVNNGSQDYLGEDVTMAEHMMQAAHMAESQGAYFEFHLR